MSLIQFLSSKTFFKQLALALVAVVVIIFLSSLWLKSTTNHKEFVTVPELKGKSLATVEIELDDNDLVMEIQDSANYNPNYPKFSVIDQYPKAGTQVKENRKIYLTLNPSGYRKVEIPNVVRRTYRQAKPTLETLGFEIGEVTYVDDIGKEEVIEIKFDGRTLKPGELLPLTSKIDVVLGNGKRGKSK
ncbi:PASTA domain-containing protein [Psychroserpens sp.]|uniref:PASTA domain-containing protein n=1 Tax=Psychroserpens sp. TaxID=2020870 RepID=UPI001B154663|nr:PASTA domain-containing protein [Psychroserpens sp.]MBO6606023.1 PASTA domain-containing protein [Psychroserpens sp.]MBO6652606.1 PASTA domain-containing protein [Psychroserpens sp.]MBO6681622.1 PASTA domain-containing protein [Psychroserpens sp.]MBO6749397.1 PASTA domain-containing protein [Psychroserpens sp.]MBO6914157.1 PASTA domain-containing protein [Psychroserpens sp.]